MGCHQSKIEEQVVAPASGDLIVHSTIEASATTEVPAAVSEETAPVTEVMETAAPTEEEESITVETPEEKAVPATEPAAEAVEEAEVTADAEPTPTPAPASEIKSTKAAPSETAPTETEEAAPTETVEAAEETPAEEPVAEKEPVVQVEQPVQEPVVETEEEPKAEPTVSFKSLGVTFGERNVVFYGFSLVDTSDPAKDVTIRKRFNDFKAIHAEVAKLMASESNVPRSQQGKFATYPALPALPKAGASSVLFGRRNPNLTGDRKTQFEKILNAIARHPIAYGSPAFQAFVRKA